MFRIVVRIVFIFAYVAFLAASINHIAYFFHSFENTGDSWLGAYALAVAIDLTSLVLAIGVMFFRKGMSKLAISGVWLFILGLTAFSWLVNWEYAIQFQSSGLNKATDFLWLNPILASSFALLNVAYSIVAELFNSKAETAEELQKKLEELRQTSALKQELSTHKNKQVSSWISGKYQMFKDGFSSVNPSEDLPQISEQITPELEPEVSQDLPEIEELQEEEPVTGLGMIEQAMYDAFVKHPEEAEALIRLSQEQPLHQFVATLQQKYSQYSGYITAKRVSNVMRFIALNSKQKEMPEITKIDANSGKLFMSWDESVKYTGYAESTLKKQLSLGQIQTNKKGDKLKVSSLKIKGNTEQLQAVKVEKVPATNGHKT